MDSMKKTSDDRKISIPFMMWLGSCPDVTSQWFASCPRDGITWMSNTPAAWLQTKVPATVKEMVATFTVLCQNYEVAQWLSVMPQDMKDWLSQFPTETFAWLAQIPYS